MNARACRHAGLRPALLAAALALVGTGCVSSKYKLAPKSTEPKPPPALELTVTDPAVTATVHTVVVFHGPGSWKKDAYWDEYVVTLQAGRDASLTIDDVLLVDQGGQVTAAGDDPWKLDASSRQRLKVARRTGRNIALGAGVGAAWYGSAALLASSFTIWGGVTNSTAAAVGATGFVAIPVAVVGSGVRTLVARHGIAKEFNRRRLDLPVTLAPGAARTGSFFFPVTPGPARLLLRYQDATGASHKLTIDLAPLAGLHLGPPAGAQPGTGQSAATAGGKEAAPTP